MKYRRFILIILFFAYLIALIVLFCVFPDRWLALLLATLPVYPCLWRISIDRKERKTEQLCNAIMTNEKNIVKDILNRNHRLNYVCSPNFLSKHAKQTLPLSPFQTACFYGRVDIVQAMLCKKPDLNKRDPYQGKTPLEWAMKDFDDAPADRSQISVSLLKQGAATARIDFYPLFQSVLKWASLCNHEDSVILVSLLQTLSGAVSLNRLFTNAQDIYQTHNSQLIKFMQQNCLIA